MGTSPGPRDLHRTELSLLLAGLFLTYLLWEYRVLTKPAIRRLFELR